MDTLKIITSIISKEGNYVDHPSDRGGPTKYGITQAVARANGYMGDMLELPYTKAIEIYTYRYIVGPQFDKVARCSLPIAEKLIDIGVNMGPAIASTFFQRILNAMNAKGSAYADIFVDGRIGPITINALCSYIKWRKEEGEQVFLKALSGIQAARYLDIAENNKEQEDFFYGWVKNRV